MFRAMLWKEYREQAAILVALLVLGTGVIAAATTLGSSTGSDAGVTDVRAYTNAGRLAVLSLAVAAGVVIGGTLFAGEKENGTLECLDALPADRLRLWRAKLAAGVVLATAAGVTLLAAGTLIGALGTTSQVAWLTWGLALVYIAFGWGTFGSTMTENTLAACAVGLICAVVIGMPVFAVVAGVLRAVVGSRPDRLPGLWLELLPLLGLYAVALFPVLLSALVFTAPDRARLAPLRTDRPAAVLRRPNPAGFLGSLKALVWLTNRQWMVAAFIGMGLAVLTGAGSLHEDVHLFIVWPFATALAGVFGGVLAWADEQSKNTFKFWGERRLPLGRLWAVKVATSFAQTLAWTLLLFAPSLVRGLAAERHVPLVPAAFRSSIVSEAGPAILYYLFLWPLYGFAFGHLAGLLFRKTIVALGVGLLTAAPVAALWLPSLLAGGVHGWQLWPVPVLILLTTRLVLRPWAADRLASVRPLAAVAAAGAACAAWIAGGLLWRAVEVPVSAELDDDLAFADTVPQLDFDDGGRDFRQTTVVLAGTFQEAYAPGSVVQFGRADHPTISRQTLARLAADCWPEADLRAVADWLAQPALDRVAATLKAAATKPLGPLENPRGIILARPPYRDANELPAAVQMLMARGLGRQLAGDPAEFVACLDAALAATRNARTLQPTEIYLLGVTAERTALDAADEWLTRLAGRPDLVRAAAAVLRTHERLCPRDAKQVFLTERMIDRNRANGIPQWATREIEADIGHFWRAGGGDAVKNKATAEAELLTFSLAVPWERERFRRVLGLNNAGRPARPFLGGSWLVHYFTPRAADLGAWRRASEARLAVALAQADLKAFEADHGRPAASLDELVPRYCPAVPRDPFDGRPLRYRVSAGERVRIGTKADDRPVGADPFAPLPVTDEERHGLSGGVGGLAWLDRPRPVAPGFDARGSPELDLDAVAAAAGGLVQSALEPLDAPPIGGPLGRGRVAAGSRPGEAAAIWRDVRAGQGIVWSVGLDLADDDGRVLSSTGPDVQTTRGDILRVVPRTGQE